MLKTHMQHLPVQYVSIPPPPQHRPAPAATAKEPSGSLLAASLDATAANISEQMPVYGKAAAVHMLICMFTALMDQIAAP